MKKKPVIGITASYVKHNHYMEGVYVHHDYHKAILNSGGIPIVLPYTNDEMAKEYMEMCDGFILSGGEDVDPQFYGKYPHQKIGFVNPERDEFELSMIRHALEKGKPLFGICRGLQILNVSLGGTLIQDLPSSMRESMQHVQTVPRQDNFHSVNVITNSVLYEVIQKDTLRVNSLHHQAIDQLASDLSVIAFADDGIIEAVQHKSRPEVFAVQWHPESLFEKNEDMKKMFRYFVALCKK